MFHKISNVEALKNYILKITFQDKTIKYYDVSKLFDKWIIFQNLKNIDGLFKQVKVDKGGYGISWNNEIDLSCNELWDNGNNVDKKHEQQSTMVAEDEVNYGSEDIN